MTEQNLIRISGKNLGNFAKDNYCPRCEWVKIKVKNLPYNTFPGIFSSIDSFTKKYLHSYFDEFGKAPKWLRRHSNYIGYLDPPHHSKFKVINKEYNILLTGDPDGVFVKRNKKVTIADYKTARYTPAQDSLMPLYETQLNAYKYIYEGLGYGEVEDLILIYFEPQTSEEEASEKVVRFQDGMRMIFKAGIHQVDHTIDLIPLFEKFRNLYDTEKCPSGVENCKNCEKIDIFLDSLK